MAVKARIDRVDTLSLEKEFGAITSVTRKIRVTGLEDTDYTVLLAALEAVGVPADGSDLDDGGPEFGNMVLHKLSPTVVDGDAGTVDVTLTYGPRAQCQDIATGDTIFGETDCSMVQKKSNFYTEPGGQQTQILLSHTFPDDDPDYPGETFDQTGEIDIYQPNATFSFEGYLNTDNPWGVTALILGKINDGIWCSNPAKTWMCTNVKWRCTQPNTPRYYFRFEFQLNLDGWQPTAVFIDQRTGKPPPNLEPDVGYFTVPYYRVINFSAAFNNYFEGWQQVG